MGDVRRETQVPAWFAEGLMFVGNWEPLAFRRRAGLAAVDEEAIYTREHRPETLRRLRALGVNLIITHFHKGFGLAAEREEIAGAAALVRDARALGLHVGAYLRVDAIAYETYLDEVPQAVDWFQRDAAGGIATYDGQEFRRLVCPQHPEYVQRVEDLVRLAAGDVGFDLIHLDGFSWGTATPCRCQACAAGFRAFLQARYPDAASRVARFGHPRVEAMEIPLAAPGREHVVRDPLRQEWLDFRSARFEDIHRRLAAAAKACSPAVAVTFNTMVPIEENGRERCGVSLPAMAPRNDAFWTESHNDPRLDGDGRVVSRVREYKYAEALDNVCFSYVKGPGRDQVRRSFAEVLAFNGGHAGMIGSPLLDEGPFAGDLASWAAFYRRWRSTLYAGTESAAQVAVLRHPRTLMLDSGEPYRSAHLLEQLLIEAGIPFRLICADGPLRLPPDLRLLVLPGVSCLEEPEAAVITAFVRRGGGLLLTGDTSLRDSWYRLRADYLLRELLGPDVPCPRPGMRSFQDPIFGQVDERARRVPGLTFHHAGDGRVVYAVRVDGPAGARAGERYPWRSPADAERWLAAARWAAGPLDVEVRAPHGVLVEVRRLRAPAEGYRVHLVNLVPSPWRDGIVVSWRSPAVPRHPGGAFEAPPRSRDPGAAAGPWRVRLYSPDGEETASGTDLTPVPTAGGAGETAWEVVVPVLDTYTVVSVDAAVLAAG